MGTDGEPTEGPVDLVFTLYDTPTGGASVWTESHDDVPVVEGVYGVALGSIVPLEAAILANAPRALFRYDLDREPGRRARPVAFSPEEQS